MNLLEAIKARHSVRSYKDQPISAKSIDKLKSMIDELNKSSGLHMQLILDEPKAFDCIRAHYGKFTNVKNYIALIGLKGEHLEESCGYYGEKLVLAAQQMGLNTCWVVGSYKKKPSVYKMENDERLVAVIAIGYGAEKGRRHRSKTYEQVTRIEGEAPQWFKDGVEAALLAPTAINQQRFRIIWKHGNAALRSQVGPFTKIDLGIVKLHFEIGSGKVFTQMDQVIDDTHWELHDRFFSEKNMYARVERVAQEKSLPMTADALPYMKQCHQGQFRKGKDAVPYIYHPLTMCCHAIALGIYEDEVLATILLHDVCEDCNKEPEELPVNDTVREAVSLLTFRIEEGQSLHDAQVAYSERIRGNRIALLVKLIDRCNNVSTMAIGFEKEQIARYIDNTEEFVYPMLAYLKKDYPQHYNEAFLLKYQIVSLIESMKRLV